ncbi:MAG: FHA domain-containing protein [Planctomycetota bacterium]
MPTPETRLPSQPRIPAPASQLPSWLGSESDVLGARRDLGYPGEASEVLDGFHLGVESPGDTEPGWEVYPARGVRIGRSDDCDVVLRDSAVSRYHAQIRQLKSGRYAVRDLMSQNGMRVNGKPTRQWTLNDGDVIQIANFRLTFGGGVLPRLAAGLSAQEEAPRDGVYGRTFAMGQDAARQLSERSVNQRAFLQVIGDRHRLAGLRVCQYVIECDSLVIGGAEEADLQLTTRLVPRICAVLIRSENRFALHPIAPWPFGPKLNGHRVHEPSILDDLDELDVGGVRFRFRLGTPE